MSIAVGPPTRLRALGNAPKTICGTPEGRKWGALVHDKYLDSFPGCKDLSLFGSVCVVCRMSVNMCRQRVTEKRASREEVAKRKREKEKEGGEDKKRDKPKVSTYELPFVLHVVKYYVT